MSPGAQKRGWEQLIDDEGRPYWLHHQSGATSWDQPAGLKAVENRPASASAGSSPEEVDRGVYRADLCRGYLTKRGHLIKNWKERYFVICDGAVHYFKTKKIYLAGGSSQGNVPLRGLTTKSYDEKEYGKKFCFGIGSTTKPRTFILVASCEQERTQWITTLSKSVAGAEETTHSASLKSVWESHLDTDGEVYYFNRDTGDSCWDRPKEFEEYEYSEAARLFNQKPKRGIEYLVEHHLAKTGESLDLVRFLKTAKGLSRKVVGEFLGGEKPFNIQVLKDYANSFDFREMSLDEALRQFLSAFRLPGEAQKIDRMMQAFADRYHLENSTVFSCADTAYILAFSLIMLNTDAHNPSIQKKMTLEQFINNNRAIDKGKDLPHELLKGLYDEIQENEIKMSDSGEHHGDALTFLAAAKEGWLNKKGERGMQRRWFLLMDNTLYYFTKPDKVKEEKPRCIYPLEDVKVSEREDGKNMGLMLETKSGTSLKSAKRLENGDMVPGTSSRLVLFAKDKEERDEWVAAIRRSVSGDSFYQLISKRKLQMKM